MTDGSFWITTVQECMVLLLNFLKYLIVNCILQVYIYPIGTRTLLLKIIHRFYRGDW